MISEHVGLAHLGKNPGGPAQVVALRMEVDHDIEAHGVGGEALRPHLGHQVARAIHVARLVASAERAGETDEVGNNTRLAHVPEAPLCTRGVASPGVHADDGVVALRCGFQPTGDHAVDPVEGAILVARGRKGVDHHIETGGAGLGVGGCHLLNKDLGLLHLARAHPGLQQGGEGCSVRPDIGRRRGLQPGLRLCKVATARMAVDQRAGHRRVHLLADGLLAFEQRLSRLHLALLRAARNQTGYVLLGLGFRIRSAEGPQPLRRLCSVLRLGASGGKCAVADHGHGLVAERLEACQQDLCTPNVALAAGTLQLVGQEGADVLCCARRLMRPARQQGGLRPTGELPAQLQHYQGADDDQLFHGGGHPEPSTNSHEHRGDAHRHEADEDGRGGAEAGMDERPRALDHLEHHPFTWKQSESGGGIRVGIESQEN
mmetsp:Transcript_86839/g.274131  ORF Transcript_86839/g.274131 Transcript_86839/m.274131 type:complete len:431 (+) Transcript_86839:1174-2466(+)